MKAWQVTVTYTYTVNNKNEQQAINTALSNKGQFIFGGMKFTTKQVNVKNTFFDVLKEKKNESKPKDNINKAVVYKAERTKVTDIGDLSSQWEDLYRHP